MARRLVTIQKILSVESIEGSDFIEKIKVLGWQLVAKKGEFKVDDLCVYFEIDSFLPICPEFEFLRKSNYKQMPDGNEGFFLKTAKFRGVISQGLALPISIFDNLNATNNIGSDVADLIGVIKYEPPIPECLNGTAKAYLTSHLTTGEPRVQNLQPFIDKYAGEEFYYTEKIDGNAVSFFIDDESVFNVSGRNIVFEYDEKNPIWKYAVENNIESKLRNLSFNACLQGEIFGEGIQKNKYKIKGHQVRFYNILNLETRKYLSFSHFFTTAQQLSLEIVPVIENKFFLKNNMDELVELSKGKSMLNKDVMREGIVLRPLEEKLDANFDLTHSRVSFKVINPNFLLKYEE